MNTAITVFSIILSFIGIVISILSLVFAIIYLIKICTLQKVQEELNNKIDILNSIKEILISQCVGYSDAGKIIKGRDIIKNIQEQYFCDEITAIKIYYTNTNIK